MRCWFAALILSIFAFTSPSARAQVAGPGASLEPTAPQLGERARLRLDVAPTDSTLLPRALDVALR